MSHRAADRNVVHVAEKHDDLIIALAMARWHDYPDARRITYMPESIWDMAS